MFDEYVLTVENLQAGENTITLTFKSESNDATGKPKGGYLQYMRLETTTDCNGAHNLVYAEKVEAGCYSIGMEAHYECTTCGMYFKLDKVTEVSEAELEIEKKSCLRRTRKG